MNPSPILLEPVRAYSRPVETFASGFRGWSGLRFSTHGWRGEPWWHDLIFVQPRTPQRPGAILEITGWEPNYKDLRMAQEWADASGMTVALLFQIPRQPIEGRIEDELIAYSFSLYLNSKDPADLLLAPMIASSVAALDLIEAPVVVTGASKRGWTTWWVGLHRDERVVGIAPRVFDHLDFAWQQNRQAELWGAPSPQVQDYTEYGWSFDLDNPEVAALIGVVDPHPHRSRLTVPTLVLSGANDPFWCPDPWDTVAPTMPECVSHLSAPNAGHGMADRRWWSASLGGFARDCIEGRPAADETTIRVWRAEAKEPKFVHALWRPVAEVDAASPPFNEQMWTAEMTEVKRADGTRRTTPVRLIAPTD